MKIIQKLNNNKVIVECPKCNKQEKGSYRYYKNLNPLSLCHECSSREKIINTINKSQNQTDGLQILRMVSFDKPYMCIVKCPKCNSEYERKYSSKITQNKGCKKCIEHKKKHTIGHKDRLSRIINNMRERTQNPNSTRYADYGGRGITICEEWASGSTIPFYDWALANGYSDELSIDRKDNDKGYSPENCKWSTREEQQANTRIQKDNKTGYRGVSKAYAGKFRARTYVNKKEHIVGYFNTPEEANEALLLFKSGAL